jgi:hypothetical protein
MTKDDRTPLLPVRHPQTDFFVCDVFDAAPKGDMASMEHPIFSLSTKPDRRARRYEHNGSFVEVQPSHLGLATVHDRDVLIYCISQLIAALNNGTNISQTVRLKAYDLLRATNRQTSGRGYDLLKECFQRLRGTQISTNIITGEKETFEVFGLIDQARIVRETRDGRMQDVEIKLSDWVFNAISAKEVLTLHRDYFRLRKPLERRIYELARKHCGQKPEWRISLETLQKKSGSNSTLKEFRRLVGTICDQDTEFGHMPDYAVQLVDDMLIVRSRGTVPGAGNDNGRAYARVQVSDTGLEAARRAAPRWDVHHLEREWKAWMAKHGKPAPKHPDAAFAKWCGRFYELHGAP